MLAVGDNNGWRPHVEGWLVGALVCFGVAQYCYYHGGGSTTALIGGSSRREGNVYTTRAKLYIHTAFLRDLHLIGPCACRACAICIDTLPICMHLCT